MVDMMQDKMWSRVITAFAEDQGVDAPIQCEWDMGELEALAKEHNGSMEGVTKFLSGLEDDYLINICVGEEVEVDRLLAHAGNQMEAVHAVLDEIFDHWGDNEDI
jgi:hypothetical protein